MKIDLSEHEIKIIESALTCWEVEPFKEEFTGSMLEIMLTPKNERVGNEDRMKAKIHESSQKGEQRKKQAILLRAKLIQAESRNSEFPPTLETHKCDLGQ